MGNLSQKVKRKYLRSLNNYPDSITRGGNHQFKQVPLSDELKQAVHKGMKGKADPNIDSMMNNIPPEQHREAEPIEPATSPQRQAVETKKQKEQQGNSEEEAKKESQSTKIVKLTSQVELFHTEDDNAYGRFKTGGHVETWPIRSTGFSRWLKGKYLNVYHTAVSKQGYEDAIGTIEAMAQFDDEGEVKPVKKVYKRIAEKDGEIFIDLCNDKWQAVKINSDGWEITDLPPVYFIRSNIEQPMPMPEKGGSIDILKPFINHRSEHEWKMIVAWMIASLRPGYPYPILTIQGEQGSAKSTVTRALKELIDPDTQLKRSLPKNEKDMFIAAKNSWVLPFDNLSGISNAISDILCRISTGSSFATKTLYTNDEEFTFSAMQPIILNGIDDIAQRNDLLDRSIIVYLPPIDNKKRQYEREFWKEFEKVKPKVLGAVFDAISGAIKALPKTKLSEKPRMADFAQWATAAEKALGWEKGEFMRSYMANNQEAIEQGIEANPFADAIIQFMEENNEFVGNATKLIEKLKNGAYVDEQTVKSKTAFPSSKNVRKWLRRINPYLRNKRIRYTEYENRKRRTLKLDKVPQKSSPSSPSSPKASQAPVQRHFQGYDNGYDNSKGYAKIVTGYDNKKLSSPQKAYKTGKGDDGYASYDNSGAFSDINKKQQNGAWKI
ncbi:hypothetical protein [Sporolactobacillus putidus]|uniref:ATP-binding protein n=1 Tax=Sporolactobacillus putidus TaxID=492735 RepID=A0A917S6F2_9BACL|nr:hypothetical protein [Sporolactobacillus putidus]GGL58053.1 ATP-binding protein [Sporolactobacillus putidus]